MRTLTPTPGGLQDTVDQVHAYDVRTGRWHTLPRLPQARDHVGGAVIGDTIYIPGGGALGGGAPTDVNDAYRPRRR